MIRIYDLNVSLKGEIDDYESLTFTRKYYTFGEFEIEINADKNNTAELQKNRIIQVDKDPRKIGIIKVIDRESEDVDVIKVLGYTLDFLFRDRIILPVGSSAYDSITGPGETVIKHYIANCITSPIDPDRVMAFFNLIADGAAGSTGEYNSRYDNLSTKIGEIRKRKEMGVEVTLNLTTKKFEIDTYEGEDHTSGTANPVIFSTDYDNLIEQKYYISDVDEKTFAYVGGEGEGASRLLDTAGTGTGINRKEMFVDTYLPLSSLEEAGETELSQNREIETFEGQTINRKPFIYEQDFDLGDVVTVTNKKWGVTLNTRITAITEVYEPDGFELIAEYGNNIPLLKDIIDKKTKREVD